MNRLGVIGIVVLLAGLAGRASAQTVKVSTSPAGSIPYGTPVILQAVLTDISDCSNPSFFIDYYILPLAPTFPVGTVTPVKNANFKDLTCDADLAPISNLPVGMWTVQAIYSNLSPPFPSGTTTLAVTQASTTTSLATTPNPSTLGQTVTFTATVTPASTGPAVPTGIVSFSVDGQEASADALGSGSNGVAHFSANQLTPGTHSLTASYTGDSNYLASASAKVNQTVSQIATTTSLKIVPTSSTFGQAVALTATVSPSTATGTVTFLDGSTSIASASLHAGSASFTTSALSGGSHFLTASYGGDTDDAPSASSPVPETVSPIATTTSLKALPASSTPGQVVVLTATVSPSTATGTVFFLDGSTTIGSALLSGGTASFSTSTLSIGSHSLTASYGGDTDDLPSASSPVTEAVGLISTTTSLKVVPASSTPGQAVVLTATVSPSTATGTVFFLDGSTTFGSALLSGGSASFSTSTLSTGNHSLTASYGGDKNDAPSASSAINESVTGGTATPATPSITAIQNNYSYILPGLPGYGIAPGTLFIVKGGGLANAATVSALQSSAPPGLPLTLNGAAVTVEVGAFSSQCPLYYAIATQIAAVLPSGTPAGNGSILVSSGGNVASAPITVAQSALGLDTLYGYGSGLAVATDNITGAVINYNNSATPGQNIVLWGSGLGADTADSDTNFTTTPHAVNVPLQVYVGGQPAPVLYAGSSGYPGLNQVVVTVPSGVQPGCYVSLFGMVGTVVTNSTTLPIDPVKGAVCTDPASGINGSQILALGLKQTYNSGVLSLSQATSSTGTQASASAAFQTVPGALSASGVNQVSPGSCIFNQPTGLNSPFANTPLDEGLHMFLVAPNGESISMPETQNGTGTAPTGMYFGLVPPVSMPPTGGSFTFTGTGGTTPGASVGPLSVTVNLDTPLVWTNMTSITTVNRAQGVTVNWTAGGPNTYVNIFGSSTSLPSALSSTGVTGSFTCLAPASAGMFTVPSWVLQALPLGPGSLAVGELTPPQTFSASGIDYAYGYASISVSSNVTYQ